VQRHHGEVTLIGQLVQDVVGFADLGLMGPDVEAGQLGHQAVIGQGIEDRRQVPPEALGIEVGDVVGAGGEGDQGMVGVELGQARQQGGGDVGEPRAADAQVDHPQAGPEHSLELSDVGAGGLASPDALGGGIPDGDEENPALAFR
jgi:hypothetical protein